MKIQDWIDFYPHLQPPLFERLCSQKMIYVEAEDGMFVLRTPPQSQEQIFEKMEDPFSFSGYSEWFYLDIRETPFPTQYPVKFKYEENNGYLMDDGGFITVLQDGRWRMNMTKVS